MSNNTIIPWLTAHKAQVITMLVVFTLGLIALNYIIEIYTKADLLLNACQLCEQAGNKCNRVFDFWELNITP
jgi:hypothetical protein